MPTDTQDTRKSTQRERLVAGMVAAANTHGYAGANVARVIEHAGVSRPTFYDYFADRDDCFLQTNREISQRLLSQVNDAVAAAPPEHALRAALRRVVERAEAEPAQAHFLANATMAGGPLALDERDKAIAELERIVIKASADTPPQTPTPDLPPRVAFGAIHWLIYPRVRRGAGELTGLADELESWIERYNLPHGRHRWQELRPGPPPPPTKHLSELALHAPKPLSPGRSRMPHAEIMRNQRERIMYATATLSAHKGYTATTIEDITTTARLDRRAFYNHYHDKQDAFLAVHELAIHQIMAVGAQGYFSARDWPERIWQGILAACHFQATHPAISHMGYVESHAVGAPAIQRIEDSHRAFAIFLQEGNQHTDVTPNGTATQAITAAIFEIGYHQTRGGQSSHLPRYAHIAAYLALAPYLGPTAANAFIDKKLRPSDRPAERRLSLR
ncbi:MAG TPA: TetR/AcrR family transcriptional regulator [Solirubrobacteraceae bacterium]|jgi:AcrR family transcriptional regulator|nr:TetR/AcrR family transcriptional regulator [Solirubrobacteraceae bacterium]